MVRFQETMCIVFGIAHITFVFIFMHFLGKSNVSLIQFRGGTYSIRMGEHLFFEKFFEKSHGSPLPGTNLRVTIHQDAHKNMRPSTSYSKQN